MNENTDDPKSFTFEDLFKGAKWRTIAPAGPEEKQAFRALCDTRYAELKAKSQDKDWRAAARHALNQDDVSLGLLSRLVKVFTNALADQTSDADLEDGGWAEKHIVEGRRHWVLTEKGYMVMWAHGWDYYPDGEMAGL